MKDCPKCRAHVDGLTCGKCGYSEVERPINPDRWRCADTELGQRCANNAPFSSSTHGDGPWYCQQHFPAFRGWSDKRADPPPGWKGKIGRKPRTAADLAEDAAERFAIQAEGG